MQQKTVWLCGAAGLVIDVTLLAFSAAVKKVVPPPAADVPTLVTVIFLLFLGLALAEIPLMVFALRKMAGGLADQNPAIFCGWLTLYVAFPGVYATLSLILTGWLGGAMIIATTGVVRCGSLAVV